MSLPRAIGFYNRLLKIPILYLYFATITIVALSSGIWWYFLYKPMLSAGDIMQQQIYQMHSSVDELRKTAKTLVGLSKAIDAQNVQKKSETKMRKLYAQQSLSLIADCALNSGITVESCKLCGQHEESWCCINTMNGDFKGSFDQIIVFFDALKKSKQIIDVAQCELVRIDGTNFSLHAKFSIYNA